MHKEIIRTLHKGGFYVDCPYCNEEISLKRALLFDKDNFSEHALEIYERQLLEIRERKEQLKRLRETGASRSGQGAKSVNLGFILERLAPVMGKFRFKHNDCRSLFDPVDYVIFDGLTEKGKVENIFFIEIKTGRARLNRRQKEIKSLLESGKVLFKKYLL